MNAWQEIDYYVAQLQSQGFMADLAKRPDGTIELRMPEEATPEETAAAQATLDAIVAERPLKQARAAKLAQLDAWFVARTAPGITVSGKTFDASVEAQNRMIGLAVLMLLAKTYGYGDDATEYELFTKDSERLVLPAANMAGVLVQYGFTAAGLSGGYGPCRAAILAAPTLEALADIGLPS